MPFIIYFYLGCILMAFLSSLISFRLDFSFHLRLFSCLLGLTFIVEVLAAILAYEINESNNWLYNSFTIIEYWVYGYFFRSILPGRNLQRFIGAYLFIFPIFWFITVFFVFGFRGWNSYVIIFGSLFSVIFSLLFYFRILTSSEIKNLRAIPEFWIATGMLIYYMAALPFFGLLNFLIQYYMNVAKYLLVVIQVLASIMYIIFSYGFLCQIRNTKKY